MSYPWVHLQPFQSIGGILTRQCVLVRGCSVFGSFCGLLWFCVFFEAVLLVFVFHDSKDCHGRYDERSNWSKKNSLHARPC